MSTTYSITLAYEERTPNALMRATLKRAAGSALLPKFLGHSYVRMAADQDIQTFDFDPKVTECGAPIVDTRPDAHLLTALATQSFQQSAFAKWFGASEAEIVTGRAEGRQAPDAFVSINVSQREFISAQRYVAERRNEAISYNSFSSNCFLFCANVTYAGGFDVTSLGGEKCLWCPDALLLGFAGALPPGSEPGAGVTRASLQGKEVEIGFADQFFGKMSRRLGVQMLPTTPSGEANTRKPPFLSLDPAAT